MLLTIENLIGMLAEITLESPAETMVFSVLSDDELLMSVRELFDMTENDEKGPLHE